MSFRFGAVGALVVALALGGCASAGNGPGADGALSGDFSEDDLPQWMQDLPEGEPPEDNEYTDEATLLLFQAMSADGEDAVAFYEQALAAAEEGIEADPENAQSYFQAGEALLGMGELRRAGEMLDRAEELYPRYQIETEFMREEAWLEAFNRGAEYYQDGDAQAALPHFEDAHAIYQGRPEAMLNLAEIYSNEGRMEEAAELYGMSVDVMTGPRAQDMDEEFLENWEDFLEVALFNRAQILFQLERYAEAAEVYEAILADDPENLMAISNLAVAYVASGEGARAREIYDDLLNRPGLDSQDYFSIGVGLYQTEEFEQAARAFREAVDLVPEHRDALFNYAQSLYLADQFEELIEAAEMLIELDPYNETAYRFLAQSLVQMDRQEEAVDKLETMEALPYFIDALELAGMDGGAAVVGQVINQNADEGSSVNLRVHFYTADGTEVGTSDVSVDLGAAEEAVQFQADLATGERVVAFRYEVL